MPTGGGLQSLLARACTRDEIDPRIRDAAFEELLRLVMIYIRAGMGRRLRDHRESADVCQSIAKSFVSDFEEGRLQFDSEPQLAAYLQRIVQSKLADLARHDAAAKRGSGARPVTLEPDQSIGPSAGASISADLRRDEAYQRLLAQLSEDDQALVRLRRQGLNWEQIGQIIGKDAAAARKHFSRIQQRMDGDPSA